MLANRMVTRICKPRMIGILYPSQEISFVFALGGGTLISFKGRPGDVQRDQTTLKVEQVTIVSRNIARRSAVLGSCVFTGVSARRDHLQCDATGDGFRYAASFVTRGSLPARLTL